MSNQSKKLLKRGLDLIREQGEKFSKLDNEAIRERAKRVEVMQNFDQRILSKLEAKPDYVDVVKEIRMKNESARRNHAKRVEKIINEDSLYDSSILSPSIKVKELDLDIDTPWCKTLDDLKPPWDVDWYYGGESNFEIDRPDGTIKTYRRKEGTGKYGSVGDTIDFYVGFCYVVPANITKLIVKPRIIVDGEYRVVAEPHEGCSDRWARVEGFSRFFIWNVSADPIQELGGVNFGEIDWASEHPSDRRRPLYAPGYYSDSMKIDVLPGMCIGIYVTMEFKITANSNLVTIKFDMKNGLRKFQINGIGIYELNPDWPPLP